MNEADNASVTQRCRHAFHLAGTRLRQRGERHQKQKRDLLDNQPKRHGDAQAVVDDQNIRRPLQQARRLSA